MKYCNTIQKWFKNLCTLFLGALKRLEAMSATRTRIRMGANSQSALTRAPAATEENLVLANPSCNSTITPTCLEEIY